MCGGILSFFLGHFSAAWVSLYYGRKSRICHWTIHDHRSALGNDLGRSGSCSNLVGSCICSNCIISSQRNPWITTGAGGLICVIRGAVLGQACSIHRQVLSSSGFFPALICPSCVYIFNKLLCWILPGGVPVPAGNSSFTAYPLWRGDFHRRCLHFAGSSPEGSENPLMQQFCSVLSRFLPFSGVGY